MFRTLKGNIHSRRIKLQLHTLSSVLTESTMYLLTFALFSSDGYKNSIEAIKTSLIIASEINEVYKPINCKKFFESTLFSDFPKSKFQAKNTVMEFLNSHKDEYEPIVYLFNATEINSLLDSLMHEYEVIRYNFYLGLGEA